MYLLGYDIGSSSIKVAIVDAELNNTVDVIQYPETPFDIVARKSGWAEQHPEVWWQSLCFATKKIFQKNNIHPTDVKGIGISYQMHGLVLIDKNQQILRPAIIWCDSRAVAIGDKAFKDLGEQNCLENYLNSPGNFTASRLKWVKDHEPHIYNQIHKVLLPGDFIAMKFTGEISTTISGLSEAILWDFRKKEIASEVLNYYGLDRNHIPEIVSTFSCQGSLSGEAAEMTGLKVGIPVSYRAGDQPNNALSLNVLNPGEIAATSGTSGVVYGIVDRLKHDQRSRVNSFAHVNYEENFDRIGALLCINGAGIQYSWMKNQIALSGRHYEDMEQMAASVPIGSDGLCVLPFGNGAERIFDNKNINAHIQNLEFNRHSRAHLYRSALEGVAFSFAYGVNILKEMEIDVDIVRVANDSMFQSEVFCTTLATLLNCHIEVVDTTGAVGAARAAGVGISIYKSLEEAVSGIEPSTIYEPRLNQSQCSQAYNYWLSCLEKTLYEIPTYGNRPEHLLKKNQGLKQAVEDKNKELAQIAMKAHIKDELLSELKVSLAELIDLNLDNTKIKEIKKLVKRIDETVEGGQDWTTFEDQFDLLHSDFFKKLNDELPKLSIPDAKLCLLLKMKMTTKEIAIQLNLSVRGVETRRYRLRKKLDLDKRLDLEEFLEKL